MNEQEKQNEAIRNLMATQGAAMVKDHWGDIEKSHKNDKTDQLEVTIKHSIDRRGSRVKVTTKISGSATWSGDTEDSLPDPNQGVLKGVEV